MALCLAACAQPTLIRQNLDETQAIISAAHKVYGPLCAPQEIATAQAQLDFTRIELSQGFARRAEQHLALSKASAIAALDKATPCGGVDQDKDTIPDIVDRCINEPEDFDNDRDEDGCRDIDPYGDEDGDGINNQEDGCVDDPEDFDGHNDEDGCPETSEDSDGDGIVEVVDKCPNEPEDMDGFQDRDGCPDPDNDNDTIPDIRDACALVAEDLDGWDDEDGCPDPDNDLDGVPDKFDQCPNVAGARDKDGCPLEDADKDGIADANDRCPTEPETKNGYLDEDGCPDQPPGSVTVTNTRVEIKDIVRFETGAATLAPSSLATLNDVVQVLKDAPTMRLRVEGHTDAEGADDANMRLSKERAQSVRVYIESQGIDPSRLSSVGYGETKPIDTNRTPNGRAKNRRVEFHIEK
jgi:OmpA-OmpF porin, OOP family